MVTSSPGEVQSACYSGPGGEDHRQAPTHCSHTNCSESGAGHAPFPTSRFFITVINIKLAIFTHLSTDRFQAELSGRVENANRNWDFSEEQGMSCQDLLTGRRFGQKHQDWTEVLNSPSRPDMVASALPMVI